MTASPASNRTVIALCIAALVLEGYDILMFGTIVPSLLTFEPWGLSIADVGALGSAAAIGMLVGSFVAAYTGDRWGKRRTMIGAVAAFSLGMIVAAVAPSVPLFAVARVMIGIGAGMVMPTATSLLIEAARPENRNRVVTVGFAGTCIGGILAAGAAVVLVADHGFRPMFLIGAVPGVILIPMLIRSLPESAPLVDSESRTGDGSRTAAVFRTGGLVPTICFWILSVSCLLLIFGVATWLPSLMKSAGYPIAAAISFLIAMNIGGMVGGLAGGWLADRFGAGRMTAVGFLCAAMVFAGLAGKPPAVVAYVLIVVAGAGTIGTQMLLNGFIAAHYPAACRTTAMGLALGVGRAGAIAGPTYGALGRV